MRKLPIVEALAADGTRLTTLPPLARELHVVGVNVFPDHEVMQLIHEECLIEGNPNSRESGLLAVAGTLILLAFALIGGVNISANLDCDTDTGILVTAACVAITFFGIMLLKYVPITGDPKLKRIPYDQWIARHPQAADELRNITAAIEELQARLPESAFFIVSVGDLRIIRAEYGSESYAIHFVTRL